MSQHHEAENSGINGNTWSAFLHETAKISVIALGQANCYQARLTGNFFKAKRSCRLLTAFYH